MISNIFTDLPDASAEERITELLSRPGIRIEQIVSLGQASPPGFWYDQPQGEWVMVVKGGARLRFEDEPVALHLRAGDFVDIPPHRRHRVEWIDPSQPTVWLAVHYSA
ncbi:cupin domain-containing protein [Dyella subtropica]|uniref:cupin domain-containing protein n=1 Tax=Dyella subtropica TaxID=2992127 RepID=UPI002258180F|nr:cupin domain-containing protein [Dyella subtropica]